MSKNLAITIKPDAIFIADSHWFDKALLQNSLEVSNGDSKDYTHKDLPSFLQSLDCSQVFLMGDIAQVLVGNIKSSAQSNHRLLMAIELLSQRSEVFWFEGNHDFALQSLQTLLPNVCFIPRKKQPLMATFNDKSVSLAHGDLFLNLRYKVYIGVLNSAFGRTFVKVIDKVCLGKLYKALEQKIVRKKIYPFVGGVESFCEKRLALYQRYFAKIGVNMPQVIVEGHFHLNKRIIKNEVLYVCLPAFCENSETLCFNTLLNRDSL